MFEHLTEQNITAIILIFGAICTVASGLLQLAGKTTASNFVGALPTTLHLGPIVQILLDWAKRNRELASKVTKTSIVFLVLGISGCSWFRSVVTTPEAWDTAKAACVLALTSSPKVVASAEARGLTGNAWAVQLCDVGDILEPWVVEAVKEDAEAKSVAVATARGLVK